MSPDDTISTETLDKPPSNFDVEVDLSKELLKLSFNDRIKIEEELHGVGCRATDETPELIRDSLAAFDSLLNDRKEREAFRRSLRNVVRASQVSQEETASKKYNCYLNDPEVRLRFLRCELFVVDKAVDKFIHFVEVMCELFGDFIAERPARLSDFSAKEYKALMSSRSHYLPFRDKSGRRIFVSVGNMNFTLEDKALIFKITMYLHWTVSEDVETQRRGVVLVACIFDEDEENRWETKIAPGLTKDVKRIMKKQMNGFPVRVASWQHYYRDTPYFRFLAALYTFTNYNALNRSIYKLHFGEHTESLYKMASYGMPVALMPFTSSGTLKFSHHRAWLNMMWKKADPQENPDNTIVECPGLFDVVFRQGKTDRFNPGNTHYRELIESHGQEHLEADKKQKIEITILIMQKIEGKNGRFLEWQNQKEAWVIMSDRGKIRKKIAGAFKQYNRSRAAAQAVAKTIAVSTKISKDDRDAAVPDEFFFMQQPSKRLKTSSSTFSGCLPSIGNGEDDGNGCFGKSFNPI